MTRSVSLLVVLCVAGCMPRIPVQRLAERERVAVAYVVDPSHAGVAGPAPEALKAALGRVFDAHNFQVAEVPLEAVGQSRITEARMASTRAASDAPWVVLVELRAQFFSQLDGRYRWEVGVQLTAERRGGTQVRDGFEMPVVLMFDHEKHDVAISTAANDVATRLGVLLDGLLAVPRGITPAAAVPKVPSMYFVMVDRFENGDPRNDGAIDRADEVAFHGGDLQGLINRLDWLAELGVQTVWVSPVFSMRTTPWYGHGAFHGYWTWDLRSVEPRFGDEKLLATLSDELHRRGMKLMLDLVLNHVGPDAPLLAKHPDWFHRRGPISDWNDAAQLERHDVHGLPDFAQENPFVRVYLFDATRRWLRSRAA